MREARKSVRALIAMGVAIAAVAVAGPSASASTYGRCGFFTDHTATTTTFVAIACSGGHSMAAYIKYTYTDNTNSVAYTKVAPYISSGTSSVSKPAGTFLYSHGLYYK